MSKSDHWEILAEAATTADRSLSADAYLAAVRQRSCYSLLRAVHGFITGLVIVGCTILLTVLLFLAATESGPLLPALVCGAVIVGLILERWLFTAIVDAVDVLVDIGRRKGES